MSYTHRYLARYWSETAGRMVADCGFNDKVKAVAYVGWIMTSKNPPQKGDVYDQEDGKVIYTEERASEFTCWKCGQARPDTLDKCPHCEADYTPF